MFIPNWVIHSTNRKPSSAVMCWHTFWACFSVQAASNSRVAAAPGWRPVDALRARLIACVDALRARAFVEVVAEGDAEEVLDMEVVDALSSVDVSGYEPDSPPLLRPLSPPSSRGGHRASCTTYALPHASWSSNDNWKFSYLIFSLILGNYCL